MKKTQTETEEVELTKGLYIKINSIVKSILLTIKSGNTRGTSGLTYNIIKVNANIRVKNLTRSLSNLQIEKEM